MSKIQDIELIRDADGDVIAATFRETMTVAEFQEQFPELYAKWSYGTTETI